MDYQNNKNLFNLDIDLLNRIEKYAFDNYALKIHHKYKTKTVPIDSDYVEILNFESEKIDDIYCLVSYDEVFIPKFCLLINKIKENDLNAIEELLQEPYSREVEHINFRINNLAYKLDQIGNLNASLTRSLLNEVKCCIYYKENTLPKLVEYYKIIINILNIKDLKLINTNQNQSVLHHKK